MKEEESFKGRTGWTRKGDREESVCATQTTRCILFFAVSAVGAQGRGTSEAGEVSLIVKGWVPTMYDVE